MDSSVKTLTITGAAAHQTTANDPTRPRRSSAGRSRKRRDEPEEETVIRQELPQVPQVPQVRQVPQVPQVPQPLPPSAVKPVVLKPPVYATKPPTPTPTPMPQQSVTLVPKPQSSTPQKVILNPPKNPRVKLNPKIAGHTSSHSHAKLGHTRKARRFIVPNLSSRFTRAKKLDEETKKTPIETIRTYLIGRGVIQAKSKAPEKMLRSMYNDFSLLKDGQAL